MAASGPETRLDGTKAADTASPAASCKRNSPMIPTPFPNEPAHPCPRVSTPLRAALCGLIAALAGGAMAAPQLAKAEEVLRVMVPYRDLNLNSADGLATLERRVNAAARTVCRRADFTLMAVSNPRRCVTEAVREARPQIDEAVSRQAVLMVSVPSRAGAR